MGTTAPLALPAVLVVDPSEPVVPEPSELDPLLTELFLLAREPRTPPSTAPRMTTIATTASTIQSHFLPPFFF